MQRWKHELLRVDIYNVLLSGSRDPIALPLGPGGAQYLSSFSAQRTIDPGGCGNLQWTIDTLPWEAGYLHIVAEPDPSSDIFAANNQAVGPRVTGDPGAQLKIVRLEAPPIMTQGVYDSGEVEICNQGDSPWSGIQLTLYTSRFEDGLSPLNAPYPAQIAAGYPVANLDPGTCEVVPLTGLFIQQRDAGTHFLIAEVTGALGVAPPFATAFTYAEGPDLEVISVEGPSVVTGGATYSLQVRVCNRGTDPTSGEIDVTVGDDYLVAAGFTSPLAPYECRTELLTGTPAPDGEYQLTARVDRLDNVAEVNEGNNTFVGGAIGFGTGPELVLQNAQLPPFVSSLTLAVNASVDVCNFGDQPTGPFEVVLFETFDDVVASPPDFPLVFTPVSNLAADACTTVSVSSTLFEANSGNLAFGADPWDQVFELLESNNEVIVPFTLSDAFCGDGLMNGVEACDDGNFTGGDGCSASCEVEFAPWANIAPGTSRFGYGWNYALGYHFTPQVDGSIVALGGLFDGTKTVRLFNRTTGEVLAVTEVTSANDFAYTAIGAVGVEAGTQYTVAAYLDGSGGSYQRPSSRFPQITGNVEILGSTYVSTRTDPEARPTNNRTNIMYGQADILFLPN